MAAMYQLEDPSLMKNQRLKSLRLIELSDHIIRLNRRENTQLELHLHQLQRQKTIVQRQYDREIYWKRLQLAQIYQTLNESSNDLTTKSNRIRIPMSFYAIKMQRNQSAPPNIKQTDTGINKTQLRSNTISAPSHRTKRTMSIFKELTLKPPNRTLGNMLILVDNQWPIRSKTMFNLKKD